MYSINAYSKIRTFLYINSADIASNYSDYVHSKRRNKCNKYTKATRSVSYVWVFVSHNSIQ